MIVSEVILNPLNDVQEKSPEKLIEWGTILAMLFTRTVNSS